MKNYKGRKKFQDERKCMCECLLTVILWSDLTMTRAKKIICRVTKMSNRDLTSRI